MCGLGAVSYGGTELPFTRPPRQLKEPKEAKEDGSSPANAELQAGSGPEDDGRA